MRTTVLFVLFLWAAAAPALTPEEQKIVDHVRAHRAEAVALLKEVVDIDSPTQDLEGVKKVGLVFKREFDQLGMATRWLELPASMDRAGHLIAETKGRKGDRVLLLGHIDTVLKGERYREEAGRAYGTGICDMKSGDVVIVQALKALHAAGALDRARISVMLTGDEEAPGLPIEATRREMVKLGKKADAALSFEETIGDSATVGRRGSTRWTLDVRARSGHSSQIFGEQLGNGAVFEAARILDRFRATLGGEKYLTFNPALIVGGTEAGLETNEGKASGKSNVIAARTLVHGDLRFLSREQEGSARERMRKIVDEHLPGTSATIEFESQYPAMTPSKGGEVLLRELQKIAEELGHKPLEALDPGKRGAGDAAFVAADVPVLDGLGGKGDGAHATGEYVELDSLPMVTERAALLIYRLTR